MLLIFFYLTVVQIESYVKIRDCPDVSDIVDYASEAENISTILNGNELSQNGNFKEKLESRLWNYRKQFTNRKSNGVKQIYTKATDGYFF